ncbi:putative Tetratricopeptide TPR_2 repeat protein [Azospirillaceae bacterium]
MTRGVLRLALLSVGMTVSACQPVGGPPTVSLSEARQITTRMTSQREDYASSQHAISDITAILDQESPDAEKVARRRAVADASAPDGADGKALSAFYRRRAQAARALGRVGQALADSREALRAAEVAQDEESLIASLKITAQAETTSGRPRAALEARLRYVKLIEASGARQGMLTGAYRSLVQEYSQFGDLESARQWLERLRGLMDGLRSKKRYAEQGDHWEKNLAWAEAMFAQEAGKLRGAEQAYRRSLALEERLVGGAADQNDVEDALEDEKSSILWRFSSGVLTPLGRGLEAEAVARQALLLALKNHGRYAPQTASALGALTSALAEQGRLGDAETLARAAIDVYEKIGFERDAAPLAKARARLGGILGRSGRNVEALAAFEALRQDLAGDSASVIDLRHRVLENNMSYGAALLAGGRSTDAVAVFSQILDRNTRLYGADHFRAALARGRLGQAMLASGECDAALTTFRAAARGLLAGRAVESADGEDEETSTGSYQQRQEIFDDFIGLLAARAMRGDAVAVAEAFSLADVVRGHSVQRAITSSAARIAVGGGATADIARREQDAHLELVARQALLVNQLSLPSDQRDGGVVKALMADVSSLGAARRALRDELQQKFPRYADLRSPPPPTLIQTQRLLRKGEALIAFLVREREILVWAIPAEGAPAFAVVSLGRAELAAIVAGLRNQLNPGGRSLDQMLVYDVAAAYKLYDALLRPVEAGWRGAEVLIAAPDKALGQLPLTVLVTEPYQLPSPVADEPLYAHYRGVPWLVHKAAVVQIPSVNALIALRSFPAGAAASKPFLGFGDPWFNPVQAEEGRRERGISRGAPRAVTRAGLKRGDIDVALLKSLSRLPETADEVRAVASALGASQENDVVLGERVNEQTLMTTPLDDRRVVMFATHGLMSGDLAGLTQPALALSAPDVAGIANGVGLLTMDQVLGLKLNADWVVLSACNTAAGDGAGAEAVSGLGRAFFYAGSRALLVTQWPVESSSAVALTTGVFRRQAEQPGVTRAKALRATELDMIARGVYRELDASSAQFSYAHPAFWAPYSLVGDGG